MSDPNSKITRRHILGSAATAAVATAAVAGVAVAGVAVAGVAALATNGTIEAKPHDNKKGGKVIVNGNINQSIVHWCFSKHWDVEQTAKIAKKMGVGSIELIAPEHFPTLKKYGLDCAIG
ncbi:MAG: hydroxypyruvate isomerase, partial [Pirellulaceae bacterium]